MITMSCIPRYRFPGCTANLPVVTLNWEITSDRNHSHYALLTPERPGVHDAAHPGGYIYAPATPGSIYDPDAPSEEDLAMQESAALHQQLTLATIITAASIAEAVAVLDMVHANSPMGTWETCSEFLSPVARQLFSDTSPGDTSNANISSDESLIAGRRRAPARPLGKIPDHDPSISIIQTEVEPPFYTPPQIPLGHSSGGHGDEPPLYSSPRGVRASVAAGASVEAAAPEDAVGEGADATAHAVDGDDIVQDFG